MTRAMVYHVERHDGFEWRRVDSHGDHDDTYRFSNYHEAARVWKEAVAENRAARLTALFYGPPRS